MQKIKIVWNPSDSPNLQRQWFQSLITQDFEWLEYVPGQHYSPDTVIMTVYQTAWHSERPWYQHLQDQGHKVIVDHLWDSDVDAPSSVQNGQLVLRCGNWFWYRHCLQWIWSGDDQYQPRPAHTRAFLMLMNKQREHRDRALEVLAPVLDRAIYSYVDRGVILANDVPHDGSTKLHWTYSTNPDWYNSTFFSVVVESYMRTSAWLANPTLPNLKTEVNEKTFKTMVYHHPFITFGSYEALAYLRREGFVTWDNLWDESYDLIEDDRSRFDCVARLVLDTVSRWDRGELAIDQETKHRLAHNHARFFDRALVEQRMRREIFDVIQEFVNA